jgi:hypothetical protein
VPAPPKIFNGFYTIKSRVTGEHRTFRILTQPKDADFAPGRRVLGLLTGPDNDSDYTGFAFVDDEGIHVWASKKSEGLWETYAQMIWDLSLDGALSRWAKNYEFMTDGRCLICNRHLTNPESVKTGIGPVCAEGR